MIKTLQIVVSGRVQGVSYRANTQRQANQLGIHGWVKNLPDGRVEIVARAEQGPLDQFLDWCRSGPTFAKVTDVNVEELSAADLRSEFHILY